MKTLPTKIDPKYSNMTPDQLARFEDMLNNENYGIKFKKK